MSNTTPKKSVSRERLNRLYWESGLTQAQIGQIYGVSEGAVRYWMKQFDINTRSQNSRVGVKFRTHPTQGHESWKTEVDQTTKTVYVHQLLAISEGEDPCKVFSGGEYHIHHKNGIPWDNRPDNIELLTPKEHAQEHPERGREQVYSDGEMLEWIESLVNELGYIPPRRELEDGWPGPSIQTYDKRFSGWSGAIREAGYEPPNHTYDNKGRLVDVDYADCPKGGDE